MTPWTSRPSGRPAGGDHRRTREGPLPARGWPDRQGAGQYSGRQLDRLLQRVCLHHALQRLHRSVGEQPLPGRSSPGQGIYEGLAAKAADLVKAVRVARLELEDATIRPSTTANWPPWIGRSSPMRTGIPADRAHLGGDGANYDIGFGALSRILTSSTPIKMMVLEPAATHNTGGQAYHRLLHRPGRRSGASRRDCHGKDRGPQGAGDSGGVPSEHLCGRHGDRHAGTLPARGHGHAELQRRCSPDRRLHIRARWRTASPTTWQRTRADGRRLPDGSGLRARSRKGDNLRDWFDLVGNPILANCGRPTPSNSWTRPVSCDSRNSR